MINFKQIIPTLAVILAAIGLYCTVHSAVTQDTREILDSDYPELSWLKQEYQLTDQQYVKIKELHIAHEIDCQDLCQKLAEKQQAVKEAIHTSQTDSDEFTSLVNAWRQQQQISQDSTLKHMFEISAKMTAEQGKRYRDNVYRNLILPGRTPHIDDAGNYQPTHIDRLQR